ncbi:MAG: protein-methionine-sulfoxide reductase heme-binding subunit MsrQ [Rhodospirillales bacterium]|jgi:sulfoxide reductase heme-binding subunit YedZ|nr:protein-methionine-sulfoxide reductase heme-binding subunit MsrQ [Rhodospirillales bacterium]
MGAARTAAARERLIRRIAKPLVFAASLAPLAWLVWLATTGGLGANPIEACNRFLGEWALRFLIITLAITPARIVFGAGPLIRFRRMLGLFAFAYVCLHLTSYVVLDQFFDWGEIWADIVKRNFITVGMIGFVLLVPLAATSTNAMVRRLGGRRWRNLHRLVYVTGVAGVVHFYMMVKADVREPLVYAAIVAVLLGFRIVYASRRRLAKGRGAQASAPTPKTP